MENIRVSGSVQPKTTKKGKTYLYTVISVNGGKPKWQSTGLEESGNKRKAERILRQRLDEYQRQAEQEEKERLEAESRKGGNILFSVWMQDYINSLGASIRESTMEGYQYRLKHITEYFSHKPITLQELTVKDLNDFKAYLLTYGKSNPLTGEKSGLAIRTVRAIKALIVSALDEALANGYILMNPARCIKVANKSNFELARKFNYMEGDELERFFQFMDKKKDPLADLVKVIAIYGLRRSEALALTLSPNSVDLKNRRLHITRTIVKVQTVHEEEKTKTSSSCREFKITDDMYDFFLKVLAKKEENKKYYGNTYQESGYLFTWEDGKPFNLDSLGKMFTRTAEEFGRPNFTLHNLRHSCSSFLFEEGWREWEIAEWLGHADAATTKRWYAVLAKGHNDKKADSLNGKFTLTP